MRLSIITVNRNDAAGLRRTIESVLSQRGAELEFLVVDGASTDGSIEVIREYADRIDRWVSEPDDGIYQAMNKGTRWANGDYCLFLNSGDWLADPEALSKAVSQIGGGADFYFADALLTDGERTWKTEYPRAMDVNFLISGMVNHQNILMKRRAIEAAGYYREDFRILSDWYLLLYAGYRQGASYAYLPTSLSYFSVKGLSNSPKLQKLICEERRIGLLDVFGPIGPSVYELWQYRDSVYGWIVRNLGYRKSLRLLLRAYRRIFKIFSRR